MIIKLTGFIAVLLLLVVSCKPKAPNVDHIMVDFKLVPFYEDLFSIPPDSIEAEKGRLINDYGSYLDAYSYRVVGAGSPMADDFAHNMGLFVGYKENLEVLDTCRKVFADLTKLKKELEQGFKFYRHYFPENSIPDVYLHISGFNQSILVDSSWVSVSIEKYLGRDCIFYEWLSIPVYLRRKMIPEKITPDVMKAIAMTQFLYNDSVDNLLSQMVYNGMIQYFLKQVMPYHSDELLFDFSKEQLEWCRYYEKMMWSSIIERKHLFTTDRMVVQKYVGESPFSYYFGQDSPGRTGVFLGYRIVQSFMKRNPDITLSQLMEIRDYNQILVRAGYRP